MPSHVSATVAGIAGALWWQHDIAARPAGAGVAGGRRIDHAAALASFAIPSILAAILVLAWL